MVNILTNLSNWDRILDSLSISSFLHYTISVENFHLQYKGGGKDYEHPLIFVPSYKYLFGLGFRGRFLMNDIKSWFLEKDIISNKYYIGLLFEYRWRYDYKLADNKRC